MSTLAAIANVSNVSFDPDIAAPALRINWTGYGDSYSVRYHISTDTDWGTPVTGTDNTGITIPALAPGVYYQFEITTMATTDDGSEASLPAYYAFTIPSGLTAPFNCTISNISATQCTVSWTGDATCSQQLIVGDEQGNITTIDILSLGGLAKPPDPTKPYTYDITGMDPNQNYIIQIASVQGLETVYGCYVDKPKQCCD